ncbi:Hypothetical protein PHPALM_7016 [Phytophthora palmivora]|uniref:Uncharacterized protein n=1 Tax=Phytophthora palmivora TaxID=4796 RepID=A0A2P4YDE2_9STRA|nr:Hypothetical protein PHPALM_7016 [Phytophthora palmivora]
MVLLFNPLQIHIRVSLVALLLKLRANERALVLSRLVKMPKNSVGSFCVAICNPSCEPVSPAYCRVIGLVDSKYHTSLLRLLKSEPLWFFLRLMAEYCEVGDKSLEEVTILLNRVAKLVCMFTHSEHFLVLKNVIREALNDKLSLSEIVGVLALFPVVSKQLDFLRYVNGFAKYARTSLIFRVLSKYKQPAFIFEMCRILDLDDAVFALKCLDRMWQRRHEDLNSAMEPLAHLFAGGGSTQVKDDFCDLIVGYRGLSAALDDKIANGYAECVVIPRITGNIQHNKGTSEMDEDNPDNLLRLPSTTPPSHQSVPLNRHLQRTRPGQAFPRKRTDRKAWWQDLDDTSSLLLPSDLPEATPPKTLQLNEELDSPVRSPQTLPSVSVLTEQPHTVLQSEEAKVSDLVVAAETLPQIETIPPIKRSVQSPQEPDVRVSISTNRHLQTGTEELLHNVNLSRSESAPATLTIENDTQWSKHKRSRGVAAALDNPLEFHVGRNKGADFLQKQRERVYNEKGASRIRHSQTPSAQAHVMEARVCRALGKRQVILQTTLSPLTRPDPHTVENAVAVLAKAAQLREFTPQGFITEAPVRVQSPARHPIRTLPTSPIVPSSSKPNIKSESEVSCELVAPW